MFYQLGMFVIILSGMCTEEKKRTENTYKSMCIYHDYAAFYWLLRCTVYRELLGLSHSFDSLEKSSRSVKVGSE